jgi:hypothetical protein
VAIDDNRRLLESDPNNANLAMNYAATLLSFAFIFSAAHPGEGLAEARSAIAEWHKVVAAGKANAAEQTMLLNYAKWVVPILSHANPAEGLALAREVVAGMRRQLSGQKPDDDQWWYLADAMAFASEAARHAGQLPESRQWLAEATAVTKPFIGAAGENIPAAMMAASLYRAYQHDRIAAGQCEGARAWWAKEVEVWQGLAPKSEYPATRLEQAKAAPPCGGPWPK